MKTFLLLATLVAHVWADVYTDLLKNITANLDSELQYRKTQHLKVMEATDKHHTELRKMLVNALQYLEDSKAYDEYAEVKKVTDAVKKKITEYGLLIDNHNTELENKRTRHTQDIKTMVQTVISKYETTSKDCYDLYIKGNVVNGVYTIKPMTTSISVYCDMENEGWTVIQRRDTKASSNPDFDQTWSYYKDGFGDKTGEFWLGNEYIYQLTSRKPYQLQIDMKTYDNVVSQANFGTFQVGSSSGDYKLTIKDPSPGQADSALLTANGVSFSTRDKVGKCHKKGGGGWWYSSCTQSSNLNGVHATSGDLMLNFDGFTPLKHTVMKIKLPVS